MAHNDEWEDEQTEKEKQLEEDEQMEEDDPTVLDSKPAKVVEADADLPGLDHDEVL